MVFFTFTACKRLVVADDVVTFIFSVLDMFVCSVASRKSQVKVTFLLLRLLELVGNNLRNNIDLQSKSLFPHFLSSIFSALYLPTPNFFPFEDDLSFFFFLTQTKILHSVAKMVFFKVE